MLRRLRTSCAALAAMLLVLSALGAPAHAQTATAFTYQGELVRSGVRVTDTCTFLFALFDAATAGNVVGSPATRLGTNAGLVCGASNGTGPRRQRQRLRAGRRGGDCFSGLLRLLQAAQAAEGGEGEAGSCWDGDKVVHGCYACRRQNKGSRAGGGESASL